MAILCCEWLRVYGLCRTHYRMTALCVNIIWLVDKPKHQTHLVGVPWNASEALALLNQRVLGEINLSFSLGVPIWYESKPGMCWRNGERKRPSKPNLNKYRCYVQFPLCIFPHLKICRQAIKMFKTTSLSTKDMRVPPSVTWCSLPNMTKHTEPQMASPLISIAVLWPLNSDTHRNRK